MTNATRGLFFFTCSVSKDLYGASPNPSGDPLPTPGGGQWLPVGELEAIGTAAAGFDPDVAARQVAIWGCRFTSKGPREIYWGPDGPPEHILQRAGALAT